MGQLRQHREMQANSQHKSKPRTYPPFIDVEALRGTLKEVGKLKRIVRTTLWGPMSGCHVEYAILELCNNR